MKILLKEIWQAQTAFRKVFNKEYDDPKLSYSLGVRIAKVINKELDGIDEQRQKLIQKYAEKDKGKIVTDPTGQIKFKDAEAFNKDFQKVLEVEIDLDIWQIPFKALEVSKCTPNEMALLDVFVKDQPTEEPKVEEKKGNNG